MSTLAGRVRLEMVEAPLSVWTDAVDVHRTSARRHPEAAAAWLTRSGDRLTRRARHGYRVTVLAFELAPTRPWAAAWHLLDGGIRGRVALAVVARQVLRCFLPRRRYRRLVDAIVRYRTRRRSAGGSPR